MLCYMCDARAEAAAARAQPNGHAPLTSEPPGGEEEEDRSRRGRLHYISQHTLRLSNRFLPLPPASSKRNAQKAFPLQLSYYIFSLFLFFIYVFIYLFIYFLFFYKFVRV